MARGSLEERPEHVAVGERKKEAQESWTWVRNPVMPAPMSELPAILDVHRYALMTNPSQLLQRPLPPVHFLAGQWMQVGAYRLP